MAEETEWKVLVDSEEFCRCRAALRAQTAAEGDAYVQVNYYFDTPAFALAKSHAMLRVRRKKNALYLQFKTKRTQEGAIFSCQEWEAKLENFPKTVNPHTYFPQAPDLECALLGDLVTFRTDFDLLGTVVSLDENVYFGTTDYEVEIEGEESAIRAAAQILQPTGKSEKGNGKFSRFLRQYRTYYTENKGENQ